MEIFELLQDALGMENWAEGSVDLGIEQGLSGDSSPKLSGWLTGQVKSFHVGGLAPI